MASYVPAQANLSVVITSIRGSTNDSARISRPLAEFVCDGVDNGIFTPVGDHELTAEIESVFARFPNGEVTCEFECFAPQFRRGDDVVAITIDINRSNSLGAVIAVRPSKNAVFDHHAQSHLRIPANECIRL